MAPTPAQTTRPPPPVPTPIYRMVHIENLRTLLAREALHAPNHVPDDGRPWTPIHATQTQADRGQATVPCGPRGIILDYVGFYFGPRSPMLYRVDTGHNVAQVDQSNIAYLVSTAQDVAGASLGFVFTDRHSLARVAAFHDDLTRLGEVDFPTCYETQWNTTPQFPDRQEKKQAEFLVHRAIPWPLISYVGVANAAALARVHTTLAGAGHKPRVIVQSSWYY